MRLLSAIGTGILALTIGVPVYAQQEQHDQKEEEKAKPAEEKKAQPEKSAKPEEKQQPGKNAKPEENRAQQPNNGNKQEQKNAQQENKNNQQENRNAKPEEKNAQQHQQQAEPGRQAQRGNGGRIPDDRYQANFGREHTFHVSQGDYSNHRFQYGGYSFGFVDAWPSNWLYTQDLYVIDINGVYYLCNPMYPGVNVALEVTL